MIPRRRSLLLHVCAALLCSVAVVQAAAPSRALSASAQPARAGESRTLTLADAIATAVKNNPQLRIARLEMEKADAQVREAIGTALPSLSASGTYSYALKKQVFFLPDFSDLSSGRIVPIEIGSDHSVQFGFTATQILFNSAVFTGVGAAKIYQGASRNMYRDAYNKTVSQVRQAWYGALFMRSAHDMMQASMKNAEDNLRNVRILHEQGIVSEYDLIRADVQVENIRPMVLEAERNLVLAMNGLRMAMGLSPDQEITVDGVLEMEQVDPVLIERAEQLVRENNPALQALSQQVEMSDALVKITRSDYLPTLTAFGNYAWQDQKNDFNRFAFNSLVGSSQIGLQLSLNLFNGFQTMSKVHQAQVDYLKMVETKKSSQDGMQTNAQNVRLRLLEARKRIETQGRTVEQAEKGYQIATARYKAGTGTQLEINDADLALMRARVNRIQAIYDYNVAAAELHAMLGIEQPADID